MVEFNWESGVLLISWPGSMDNFSSRSILIFLSFTTSPALSVHVLLVELALACSPGSAHFLLRCACDSDLANQTLTSFQLVGYCHMTQSKPIRSLWLNSGTLAWMAVWRQPFFFLLHLKLWECKPSFSRSHLVTGGDCLFANGANTR